MNICAYINRGFVSFVSCDQAGTIKKSEFNSGLDEGHREPLLVLLQTSINRGAVQGICNLCNVAVKSITLGMQKGEVSSCM